MSPVDEMPFCLPDFDRWPTESVVDTFVSFQPLSAGDAARVTILSNANAGTCNIVDDFASTSRLVMVTRRR